MQDSNVSAIFWKWPLAATSLALDEYPVGSGVDTRVILGGNNFTGFQLALPHAILLSRLSVQLLSCNVWNLQPVRVSNDDALFGHHILQDSVAPACSSLAQPLSPTVGVVAVGATWAAVSGVLGSGAAIAALQDLGAFGYSACAPPALKTASGPARYLMSPFVDGGSVAVVLGNIGVAIGFFGAHWLAVRVLARRSVVPPPEVSLKFPNTSYWVATLAMRGVAVAGVGELFSGTPGGTVVGVIAVAAVGGLFGSRYRLMVLPTERLFVFRTYRHAVRAAFVLPSALPLGRWGPTRLHATHGRLRGSVRPAGVRLALLPQVHSLASLVVVGLPVPRDLCHVQWAVVCVFPLCACALALFRRPARVPLRNVLDATRYLLSFVLCVALAVAAAADSEAHDPALVLVSVVSLLTGAHGCVVSLHQLGVSRWEAQQLQNSTKVSPGATALGGIKSLGFLKVDDQQLHAHLAGHRQRAQTSTLGSAQLSLPKSTSRDNDAMMALKGLVQLCCEQQKSSKDSSCKNR